MLLESCCCIVVQWVAWCTSECTGDDSPFLSRLAFQNNHERFILSKKNGTKTEHLKRNTPLQKKTKTKTKGEQIIYFTLPFQVEEVQMLLNAQQLALEILSNMCCPDGKARLAYFTLFSNLKRCLAMEHYFRLLA